MLENSIPGKTITLESLHEMFDSISENTDWEMDKPMLWGYFFTNNEPDALEAAKEKLVQEGFNFVNIFLSDKDEPDEPDLWWLHIEKEEVHSPESLDKRNDQLYIFAANNGLDSYDGMDVGPINQESE
jgi:hypothetical protein